jgi:hypothetical protein
LHLQFRVAEIFFHPDASPDFISAAALKSPLIRISGGINAVWQWTPIHTDDAKGGVCVPFTGN